MKCCREVTRMPCLHQWAEILPYRAPYEEGVVKLPYRAPYDEGAERPFDIDRGNQ